VREFKLFLNSNFRSRFYRSCRFYRVKYSIRLGLEEDILECSCTHIPIKHISNIHTSQTNPSQNEGNTLKNKQQKQKHTIKALIYYALKCILVIFQLLTLEVLQKTSSRTKSCLVFFSINRRPRICFCLHHQVCEMTQLPR
jgi:hypothetical protein